MKKIDKKTVVGGIDVTAYLGDMVDQFDTRISLSKKHLYFSTENELHSFLDRLSLFLNKEIARLNDQNEKTEIKRVLLYEDIGG